MRKTYLCLLGAVSILLYDTSTAILAQSYEIRYELFGYGSSAICVIFGFFAARRSGMLTAGFIGAFIGAVESTLGWYISWTIGPGKPDIEVSTELIIATVVFVTLESSVFGLAGGLFGWFTRREVKN